MVLGLLGRCGGCQVKLDGRCWWLLHAGDIRTLATSETSLRCQVEMVKEFADQNLQN